MNAKIDISKITLKTDRLTLRPWNKDDLDDFYEYASVDGVGQPAGWLPHESIKDTHNILKLFIANKNVFAIEYCGRVVGSLGIDEYDEELLPEYKDKLGRELGFVLAKDCWGMGLMPEAVGAVISYLFDTVKLDFIVCCHYTDNERSARVQQKCGFKHVRLVSSQTSYGAVKDKWVSVLLQGDKDNYEI